MVAYGLCKLFHLLCSVGLCPAVASVAHSFPLMASKVVSGVSVATAVTSPTYAFTVFMVPLHMAMWLLLFVVILFPDVTLPGCIVSRLSNAGTESSLCSDDAMGLEWRPKTTYYMIN